MSPSTSRYFDSASSARLHPAARETLLAALDAGYADPRRLHHPARSARLLLDNARAAVAESLDVHPDDVTFVSSGTDAVHRGLLGLLAGSRSTPPPLVVSAVEHSSVRHAARWAERVWGTPLRRVGVDRTGAVDPEEWHQALHQPVVGALQQANHEVGTVQPVDQCAHESIPLFVDACASAGRLALPEQWSVAAASAHKWGGPAGVGVLLVRRGVRWRNPFPDDDRIDPRTAGFENVPAILAAAAALQAVVAERAETTRLQHDLIDKVRAVAATWPDVEVVGDPVSRLPHLLTFSCLYVDGEALVIELDRLGFSVASGSACTSSALAPSHVLEAMGVLTHGNVRLSLERGVTAAAVDEFLAAMPAVISGLRARVGL